MGENLLVTGLDCRRLNNVKRAYTTRRVRAADMKTIVTGHVRPRTGDLLLARVRAIGKQKKLERTDGRRAHMMVGDEILVCYGNRYAPDQFEAVVSEDLSICDLVAAGGIAGRELARHDRMLPPTQIEPIGLVADAEGVVLNLAQYAIGRNTKPKPIPVVLVAGTAMNAGKTYSAASLINGLHRHGHKVAGIKITGTGAGGDVWQMKDFGAQLALDFTSAGFASTYLIPNDAIVDAFFNLVGYAGRRGCEIAVVEVADGLYHEETSRFLQSAPVQNRAKGILFAAYDSMGAVSGYNTLVRMGHSVLGISGRLTRSPLAIRETQAHVACPVYDPGALQMGCLNERLTGKKGWQLNDSLSSPALDDVDFPPFEGPDFDIDEDGSDTTVANPFDEDWSRLVERTNVRRAWTP